MSGGCAGAVLRKECVVLGVLRKQHGVTRGDTRTPGLRAWHIGRIDDAQRKAFRFEIIAQCTYLVLSAWRPGQCGSDERALPTNGHVYLVIALAVDGKRCGRELLIGGDIDASGWLPFSCRAVCRRLAIPPQQGLKERQRQSELRGHATFEYRNKEQKRNHALTARELQPAASAADTCWADRILQRVGTSLIPARCRSPLRLPFSAQIARPGRVADRFRGQDDGQPILIRANPGRPEKSALLKQDQPGGWPA